VNAKTTRTILTCLLLAVLLPPVSAAQHQSKKLARIGTLSVLSPSAISARMAAFREGLRERGYMEGKNIVIESRFAQGKLDRFREHAAELVRLKVDIIVTNGPLGTRFAKEATSTIPIVMAWDNDPVGNGFVASLARPGGNITGLSTHYPEVSGKQMELLKEIVPSLSRIAVMGSSAEPGHTQSLRETEIAAKVLGLQLQYWDVTNSGDIGPVFRTAVKQRAEAILVLAGAVFLSQRTQLADLAIQHRIPAVYQANDYVEVGGLMTYGVSINDLFRRAATYVDKILKGTKPSDIPVEQPTKFELVINLKTAKQIGLTIPPNVLARADRVIR
jgi:putative ABC transport system substrate-binding protein